MNALTFLRIEYRAGNLVAVFDRGQSVTWYIPDSRGQMQPRPDDGTFCLNEESLRVRITNSEAQNLDASVERHALARLLAEKPPVKAVDHLDGDPHNNSLENLEIVEQGGEHADSQ